MEHLTTLLRAREGELQLREQTRLLDEREMQPEQRAESAEELASRQGTLRSKVGSVRQQVPLPALQQALDETDGSMQQVEKFLKRPRTDVMTQQAQEQAVQLLSDAINVLNEQSQGGGGSSAQQQQQMALLMEMMGLQPPSQPGEQTGQAAGGSRAGGSASQRPSSLGGDATGREGEGRVVRHSSGYSGSPPAEFREALENYYRAIEQELE